MAHKVRHFGSVAEVSLDSGVAIQAASPDSRGDIRVVVFNLGPTGEALTNLVRPWAEKLAADMDLAMPIVERSSNHLSRIELSWKPKPATREQILVGLAELVDSKEFAEALQKSQEG